MEQKNSETALEPKNEKIRTIVITLAIVLFIGWGTYKAFNHPSDEELERITNKILTSENLTDIKIVNPCFNSMCAGSKSSGGGDYKIGFEAVNAKSEKVEGEVCLPKADLQYLNQIQEQDLKNVKVKYGCSLFHF